MILTYFDYYSSEQFKAYSDQTIIEPIGDISYHKSYCYMIYPSPNGFLPNSGVHIWKVKYIENKGSAYGIRSIGVTSKMKQDWVRNACKYDGSWPTECNDRSFVNGRFTWKVNEILEVRLNMDLGIVEYYNGIRKLRENKLYHLDRKYYFALFLDCDKRCGVFQSIWYQ